MNRLFYKSFVGIILIPLISITACHKEKGEELVYLKSADGNFDLYKSDVLGQWEDRLTTNVGWDWQAKWNPALESILYYSYDSAGVFSVKAQTLAGQLTIMPMGELVNYQLTSDAKRIIYIERDSIKSNIWWCNVDGSDREALTKTQGYNGRVAVHPNEQKIAFISDRTGRNELFLLDLKTNALDQLTDNEMIEKYLSWSPNGRQIAVTMKPNEEAKEDIYVVDTESRCVSQITNTAYAEQEIAWSLSGEKIAFHGTTDNDGDQIYTINLMDGSFVKVTSGDFYHGEPCWIPIR